MTASVQEYANRLREAMLVLKQMESKLEAMERERTQPIAIIGMGCRFPGGITGPNSFWKLLERGGDAITEVPAERWSLSGAVDGDDVSAEARAVRWGAFLKDVDLFDAQFFGISPREAMSLDPQQRLLLEVTWEALEHAGQVPESLVGSRTGVFVGMSSNDFSLLKATVGSAKRDVYDVTGNGHCFPPGRLSYVLDFRGPSLAVDTACSSSLVAIHLACQSLRNGESALALAGGVNLMLSPTMTDLISTTGALSPDGRCKTFDARANGFVRGEGCGVLVLKRLSDAMAAGDRVLAVIRGSAMNQDGRSTGLTAPNVLSQQALLRSALESARVSAADIGYIETHGTGTSLGDPIELEALGAVLGAPRLDGSVCALGALKTNVGHLEAAAGVASVIKVVLSMQHQAIPGNLHFKKLNPRINLDGMPFVIPTEKLAWGASGKARLAGVSSFGISGTNAHVVLEEAPRVAGESAAADAWVVLPLSAKSREALAALAEAYRRAWADGAATSLRDIAYTASVRRSHHAHRLAVVGRTRDEIAASLEAFTRGEAGAGVVHGDATPGARPKVVFVYPGQGSQWVGMGRRLREEEPAFRAALDACDQAIARESGFSVIEELHADAERSKLAQIDVVQPALFAIEVALTALWRSWGVEPDAVVGHSMGEVAAAHVSGALSLEDAARIICRRSKLLRRVSGQGAMALVELSLPEAEAAIRGFEDRLSVAVSNSPRSTVLSGDPRALDEVAARLTQEGVFCRMIKVDVASHSPQMDPLLRDIVDSLAALSPRAARIPMYSTVTGAVTSGPELTAEYWGRNLRAPVLFSQSVQRLLQEDHTLFVEMSPHPILVPAIEEALRHGERTGVALPSFRREQDERRELLLSFGALYAHGFAVDWKRLYPSGGQCIALPTYPFQRQRYWVEAPPPMDAAAARRLPLRDEAAGLTAESHAKSASDEEEPSDRWLYELAWHRKDRAVEAPETGAKPSTGAFLLCMDRGGAGAAVSALLEARGEACVQVLPAERYARIREGLYEVDGRDPEGYRAVLKDAFGAERPCRGVIHMGSLDATPIEQTTPETLHADQRQGTMSALHLAQALLGAGWQGLPRLLLVTRGAQPAGSAVTAPAQAPVWGIGRTLLLEHPELRCTQVDLSPKRGEDEASALLGELASMDGEDQVALREDGRYVTRLVRTSARTTNANGIEGPTIRSDGSYLITGGLGGLGLSIAQWMVEKGARHVVLVGRSKPTDAAQAAIAAMKERGAEIRVVAADVSRSADVDRMFEDIERHAPPLRGVLHAAAVIDDRMAVELTWESFEKVMGPKILGAWNLHTRSLRSGLDFFVLYSSAASLVGSPGQGNYAASNTFLDALAHHRRALGLPGLSINWGPFSEVGLAAAQQNRGERLSYRGIKSISPEEGAHVLERLLRAGLCQAGVLDLNLQKWLEFYPAAAGRPLWSTLSREGDSAKQNAGQADRVRDALMNAAPEERPALLERHIIEELGRILRLPAANIDRRAAFGSLGVDSLMSLELRNRLATSLGLKLPATLLLTHIDVASLGQSLLAQLALDASEAEASPLPVAHASETAPASEQGGWAPLSYGQRALWFLYESVPESTAYNVIPALRIRARLDVASLRRAFQQLARRHPSLRTTYALRGEEVLQRVEPSVEVPFDIVDTSGWSDQELPQRVADAAHQRLNLERGQILKVELFSRSPEDHVLLIVVHHVAVDLWSLGVIMKELSALYAAEVRGARAELPALPATYVDFARWQVDMLAGAEGQRHLEYWKKELRGELPVLHLPTDRARPPVQTYRGGLHIFSLPPELAKRIKSFARTEGTTLYTLLLAAFKVLLHRITGQGDLLVGSAVAGRSSDLFQSVVGYFVSPVVLRSNFEDDPTFRAALHRITQTVLGAIEHQDYPFLLLVEQLLPYRDPSRTPMIDVMFVLQRSHIFDEMAALALGDPNARLMLGDLEMESFSLPEREAMFDITMMMAEAKGTFFAWLQYNADLFDAATIERIAGQFVVLLESIVETPERRVSELPLLTNAERQQVISAWNETDTAYPKDRCVHELFEAQAARTPDAVAAVYGEQRISYGELDRRANRLAHHLRSLGVGPEVLVGICIERSVEMVVGLLGILKAGGAYVPLDPTYPKERLAFMLRDTRAPVVITQVRFQDRLPQHDGHVVYLEEGDTLLSDLPTSNPASGTTSRSLAYVIYTSGSTGQPKGAAIEHRSITRLVLDTDYVRIDPTDRVAQAANCAFDAATFEIWGPLLNGASIVGLSRDVTLNPQELARKLRETGITTIFLTTALFNQIARDAPQAFATARTVLFGGEMVDPGCVREVISHGAPARLLHVYGPTETTTFASWHLVENVPGDAVTVPIGRPIANTRLYVLDAHMRPVPIGVPGELYIGGPGVARGYLNQPELTAARFVEDPFSNEPGARLYKTGDVCRRSPDGALVYLRRADQQVKIRGFRIELGEIESVLLQYAGVKDAVVVAREDTPGDRRLVAYVVADRSRTAQSEKGADLASQQIQEWSALYDDLYQKPALGDDATLNTIGWESSYTRQPYAEELMRVWRDCTVARIRALEPRRVWEIGCGTGLLLLQIAPGCDAYLGTDFSEPVLQKLRPELVMRGLSHVRLERREANAFTGEDAGTYDTIILNSIVQYFPSSAYLREVIEGAVRAVGRGGRVFLGDIRNQALLEAFHASVELYRAAPDTPVATLRERWSHAVESEGELLVAPDFFRSLCDEIPRLTHAEIWLKRGRGDDEMTRYRYDVVLFVEEELEAVSIDASRQWERSDDLTSLSQWLREAKPRTAVITGIPSARVYADCHAMDLLSKDEGTAGEIAALAASAAEGAVSPESLGELGESLGYTVRLTWSAASGHSHFDALLERDAIAARPKAWRPEPAASRSTAQGTINNPLRSRQAELLVPSLRELVKRKLPEYMAPSAYVELDVLPLTPNGKVDRKALPAPSRSRSEAQGDYVAPRSAKEELLTAIWGDVLRVERVGVHDNFFMLGGDSILAIRVMSKAQQAGLALSVRQMFVHQTIAGLAGVATTAARQEADQGPVTGPVELSPIQRWFFDEDRPEPHHFNQAVLLETRERMDPRLLERAVAELVRHHDALRLRFLREGSSVRQINAGLDEKVEVVEIDLSAIAEEQQVAAIEARAAELQASLRLDEGPLLRVALLDLGPERPGRLLFIIHHLAVDSVSWRILLEDLETTYRRLRSGELPELPAKTTSFKAWSERLSAHARTDVVLRELAFWQALPAATPLPVDAVGGANTVASERRVEVALDAEETRALLQDVPSVYRTQINDVLLTALVRAFEAWTGERSLRFDLEGHGREELFSDLDVSRTVGWFTALFPVSIELPGSSPGEALKSVKEQLRRIPERGVGYGLLRYLSPESMLLSQGVEHRSPEVSFNYLGQMDASMTSSELFRWTDGPTGPLHSPKARRGHWIEINGWVAEGRLSVVWAYSENIHRRETIEALARRFMTELRALLAHCLSPEAGGRTPSDYSLAHLTQGAVDQLVGRGREVEDLYPLTPVQQGILYHILREPSSGVYFNHMTFRIAGRLDVEAFRAAWQRALDRHPILRTSFVWEGVEEPLQVVHSGVELPWVEHDLRGLTAGEKEAFRATFLAEDRARGFDPGRAPLLRCALHRLSEDEVELIWSHNHLLLDGWSMARVLKEVFDGYEAAHLRSAARLPSPRPYRDYIAWLGQQDPVRDETYWRRALEGFSEPTPLFVDRPKGSVAAPANLAPMEDRRLSADATAALDRLARTEGLTLSTLAQGAWALLLSHYSGQSDVVFGATMSGRSGGLDGIESMVGMFVNTLPVRVRVPPDVPVLSWLKQLQEQQAEMLPHAHSALSRVQGWSDVPRGRALFESLLVVENYPVDASLRQGLHGLAIKEVCTMEQTNYLLTVLVVPGPELLLRIEYAADRFDPASVARMVGHFAILMEGLAAAPSRRVAEVPLLSQGERHELLFGFNDTRTDAIVADRVHELFEAQARRTPDAVAVEFEGQELSYREVNQKANQVAHHLRSLGVGPDVNVGICVERSIAMVVGLLGILKAGGAYVPIDPLSPMKRIVSMIEDAAAPVLLTQASLAPRLPAGGARLICLDADEEVLGREPAHDPAPTGTPDSLAYIIYTSGSTGEPKGVAMPHRALVNLLTWQLRSFGGPAATRTLQFASMNFDVSFQEIFSTWSAGGTLVLLRDEERRDPLALLRKLDEARIQRAFLPPVVLQQIAEAAPREEILPRALGEIITAGEQLVITRPIIHLVRALPGCVLQNHYGPTEAHVVTAFTLPEALEPGPAPIGRPIDNAQIFILDARMEPVPVGIPGELYIGGVCLARGYWRRPELTQQKFVADPRSGEPGTRLYKTGDRARYRADGTIEFLGRADNQIKIRGFRIELGEIEVVLGQHPDIDEVVVVVHGDSPQDKRLTAYIVEREGASPTAAELRAHLQTKLPDYMIPAAFVRLPAMPLSPNGKVDRRALPAPELTRPERDANMLAPRDTTELALVRIWEEILSVHPIGVHDDFFALGGHSLLAVRLMTRIKEELGRTLPLAALLEGPTIEAMALKLRDHHASKRWSPLVTLQPSGRGRPIFFVHPLGGMVLCYADLARHLGNTRPFYALQAQGFDDGLEPLTRIEDMAAQYVEALREVQPKGPYLLGGWSLGGTIAFEMAQQLLAAGQAVDLLVLLDSVCPDAETPFVVFDTAEADVFLVAAMARGLGVSFSDAELFGLDPEARLGRVKELLAQARAISPGLDMNRLALAVKKHASAMFDYRPRHYPGRIVYLRPTQQVPPVLGRESQFLTDPSLLWAKHTAQPVEVRDVPGDHFSMVIGPHARTLADELGRCLLEVDP
ncbi:non-ribosomal peptide synthetase/type I polyketide synthase [Polyangium fumosum]|uniref:Amino acid adenylation domain-containing protein n=1 Tax=Polyangium fumosum TaxID=889272 RepID=A0A4U1IUE2_9BACT|nr:non-ribosomal peptide synthetase/type I polyketide synthase [Polyangium fumosum]TKC98038.1 amino acid adenylation domain-containing protein [Polyangium fumosum]